jgi:LysM repeat protein
VISKEGDKRIMKSRNLMSFLTIALVAILLVACSRSSSKAPSAATPTKGNYPALKTPQNMGNADAFKTQTAIAQKSINPIADTPTPLPPVPTNTSAPVEQQPTATQAPIVVPAATPGMPATYKLQKGEYPYCIARRFNLNPEELLSVNGLSKGVTVYEGRELKIPQTGNHWPGSPAWHTHPTTYKVNADDTIYTIACYFGDVDPMVIAQVNGLAAPYTLTAGQTLQIP